MRNFETTHCTPLPASEFHSPWRLWTSSGGCEGTVGRTSDWSGSVPRLVWITVFFLLHQVFFFSHPGLVCLVVVMCSFAVMASGKIWKPVSLWRHLRILYNMMHIQEFSVLLFSRFLLNKIMNAVHTSHLRLLPCSPLCVKRQSSVEMLLLFKWSYCVC